MCVKFLFEFVPRTQNPQPTLKTCYCSLVFLPASPDSTAEEGYKEILSLQLGFCTQVYYQSYVLYTAVVIIAWNIDAWAAGRWLLHFSHCHTRTFFSVSSHGTRSLHWFDHVQFSVWEVLVWG